MKRLTNLKYKQGFKMIDYSGHLMQMDKLKRQMENALRKNQIAMACELCAMLMKETMLLELNLLERKREQESRQR